MNDAIQEAFSKGPVDLSCVLSKMSTEFLEHVVAYFEGNGNEELQYPDSAAAYKTSKLILQNRADSSHGFLSEPKSDER